MRFAKHLYIGEGLKKNNALVRWKISHGAGLLDTYCIVVPKYGDDPLVIYHNFVFKQKIYHKLPIYIVGIASGYEEAAKLSWKILCDVHEEDGSYDTRNYFQRMEDRKLW
ncbi:MAG: hypothetical protein K6F39_06285 [Lachnospiraceae bacterium]|nr:hypothetical protein [Lachnospiraceae bacterium]